MILDDDDDGGNGVLVTDFSGDSDDGFDMGDGGGGDDGLSLEQVARGTFQDLSGQQEESGQEAPSAPTGTQQPPAGTQPGSPPPQGQQVQNPQPEQQPVQGSQPQAQGTQPAQQPKDFVQTVQENYGTWVEQLASSTYKLTDEEAATLGDAAPVVPKLLARMHLNSQIATAQALTNALPQVVANLVQVAQRGNETEQQFFNSYPELKSVPKQQLFSLGVALRQANPNMEAQQFFQMLAVTAAAAQGLQLAPVRGKAQPHTPANAQRRGTPAPRQQPTVVRRDPLSDMNAFLRNGD